mgnify:CR=1 FL=1
MKTAIAAVAIGLVLAAAGVARADAIDGNWCHADGRNLAIKGPQLTTPGGKRIEGDYDRHGFTYVVPAFEPDAGATITMVLLSETQSTYIPLGVKHRLENPGKVPLELIEVQSGSYLGEDDIVRFEDVYGRSQ